MDKIASLALRFTEALSDPESGRAKNFRDWIAIYARPRANLPATVPPDASYARSRDGVDEIFHWWVEDDRVFGIPVPITDPSYEVDPNVAYVLPVSALPSMPRRAA